MKCAFILSYALCILIFTETFAFALDKKVTLSNNTQVDIYTVKISPTKQNNWEENLLQAGTLPNGDKAVLEISRTENAEAWDLTVTDKYGNQMTWVGLPLNKEDKVSLLPNGQFLTK